MSDNDDLSLTHEHIIAGIVILLFGLLYWFLNNGWNQGSQSSPLIATAPALTAKKVALNDGNNQIEPSKNGYPLTKTATTTPIAASTATGATTSAIKNTTDNTAKGLQAKASATETSEAKATDNNTDNNVINSDVVSDAAIESEVSVTAMPSETQESNLQTPPVADTASHVDKALDKEEIPSETTALTDTEQNSDQKAEPPADTVAKNTQQEDVVPSYSLPDGTIIKISPNGFEGDLQQLFQNGELNKPLTFDQIYFDTGSNKINAKSDRQIRVTAALMNAYPETNILLRGHTDNRGSPSKNFQLSLMRANSMGLALGELGIDTERIRVLGMGERFPIAPNSTEEGRKKNRRIEILLQ